MTSKTQFGTERPHLCTIRTVDVRDRADGPKTPNRYTHQDGRRYSHYSSRYHDESPTRERSAGRTLESSQAQIYITPPKEEHRSDRRESRHITPLDHRHDRDRGGDAERTIGKTRRHSALPPALALASAEKSRNRDDTRGRRNTHHSSSIREEEPTRYRSASHDHDETETPRVAHRSHSRGSRKSGRIHPHEPREDDHSKRTNERRHSTHAPTLNVELVERRKSQDGLSQQLRLITISGSPHSVPEHHESPVQSLPRDYLHDRGHDRDTERSRSTTSGHRDDDTRGRRNTHHSSSSPKEEPTRNRSASHAQQDVERLERRKPQDEITSLSQQLRRATISGSPHSVPEHRDSPVKFSRSITPLPPQVGQRVQFASPTHETASFERMSLSPLSLIDAPRQIGTSKKVAKAATDLTTPHAMLPSSSTSESPSRALTREEASSASESFRQRASSAASEDDEKAATQYNEGTRTYSDDGQKKATLQKHHIKHIISEHLTMRTLSLKNYHLTREALLGLSCAYLEELDFSGCTADEENAEYWVRLLRRLQKLTLSNWDTIHFSKAAVHAIRELKELNVSHVPNFDDDELASIADFTQLQTLNVSGCTKLTDTRLRMLRKLQALTTLHIGGCPLMTADGIGLLSEMRLTSLHLDNATQLGDEIFETLKFFATLETVSLANCTRLTGDGLQVLSDLPLETLNLSGCTNLNWAFLERLLEDSSVQTVILKNCQAINPVDITDYIASRSTRLKAAIHFITGDQAASTLATSGTQSQGHGQGAGQIQAKTAGTAPPTGGCCVIL